MDDFERLFERFVKKTRRYYPDIDGSFTGRNAMKYDHVNGFTGPADLREAIQDVLDPFFADYCEKMHNEQAWEDCHCPDINDLETMLVENVEAYYGEQG